MLAFGIGDDDKFLSVKKIKSATFTNRKNICMRGPLQGAYMSKRSRSLGDKLGNLPDRNPVKNWRWTE